MLFPILIAVSTALGADTIPEPVYSLLGETIAKPTFSSIQSEPSGLAPTLAPLPPAPLSTPPLPRPDFATYVSTPMPVAGIPGMPTHIVEAPAELGFTRTELDEAVRSVENEIRRGAFPGAAVAIGRWDRTVVERGIGTLDRSPGSPAVDPDHAVYDLASLTKVVATTTAVMLLVEDGKLDIDAPVSRYLPAFTGGEKGQVTIRHLLTHSSGLPAGGNTAGATPDQSLASALSVRLVARPGQKVEYSDIGFIVLWAAAESANGGPLDTLLRERVFEPLEMWSTTFRPGETCIRCAPTLDRPDYRGVVHDPIARRLGGIAGHAGLFSTAHDLSRFAAMLVNGGELNGVRILQPITVEQFTRKQAGVATRALGWDTPDPRGSGSGGLQMSPNGFGHTGFTGTSLWVDPVRGTWVVLLANRTLAPVGPNRIQELRRELNDRVATSVDAAR